MPSGPSNEYTLAGIPSEAPTPPERLSTCLRHLELLRLEKGDRAAVLELRKQLSRYLRGIPHVTDLLVRLHGIADPVELREVLLDLLDVLRYPRPCEGEG